MLLELVAMDAAPMHLLLGTDALGIVREKLAALGAEIDRFDALSRTTDY